MHHPPVPPPRMSGAEADRRNSGNLLDAEALLAKADLCFGAGDHASAGVFYTAAMRAIRQRPDLNRGAQGELSRIEAMCAWLTHTYQAWLLVQLERAGFGREQRHPRFQKSLEILFGQREPEPPAERYPQDPMNYYYPDLPYLTFADTKQFAWKAALEMKVPAMRDEAVRLLQQGGDFRPYIRSAHGSLPQGDVLGLLENDSWTSFALWEKGAAVTENVARAPTVLETVMGHAPLSHVGARSPNVFLSLLRSGAHIPPHTGLVNFRFICHMPLIVPPGCSFRVGADTIAWEEGKLVVFDDTVEHEAWNRGAENRLIVLFDVWRPELTEAERRQIQALFAAIDAYASAVVNG